MNGKNSFIVDTNILIDLMRGEKLYADRIASAEAVYIPVFVYAELLLGIEISNRKSFHQDQINFLLTFIKFLNTSTNTAKYYAKVKAGLKAMGRPIPENDIWIAALAVEYNLPLVTKDKHFGNINELKITDWY